MQNRTSNRSKLKIAKGNVLPWLVIALLFVVFAWLGPSFARNFAHHNSDSGNGNDGSGASPKVETLGNAPAESLAWSPDGRYLATAYMMDISVRIWEVATGRTEKVLNSFKGSVNLVSWSPDGKYLATESSEWDNHFRVWDTLNWQELFGADPVPRTDKTITSVTSISWSP